MLLLPAPMFAFEAAAIFFRPAYFCEDFAFISALPPL